MNHILKSIIKINKIKTMKEYEITVNLDIDYKIKAKSKKEAIKKVKNMELPHGYAENSFMITAIDGVSYRD